MLRLVIMIGRGEVDRFSDVQRSADGRHRGVGVLGRAVRWCLDHGISQFLDLGSGIPTVGNVHEIAHRHAPHARVAYVDFEPVAVAHAQDIITTLVTDRVTVTRADARHPRSVLTAPGVTGLLDLAQPVALLAVAVLPFIPGDASTLIGSYRTALAPGSVVVLSHLSDDHPDPVTTGHVRAMRHSYETSATPLVLRSRRQITAALAGLDLAPPGLVDVVHWPVPNPGVPTAFPTAIYGAAGWVADTLTAPARRRRPDRDGEDRLR